MGDLKTPDNILSRFQEKAKFNFVWRINAVFNSMKHAFENSGKIDLVLAPGNEGEFKMTYSDDGTWKDNPEKTFGTQLIEVFTDQLEGTYNREINASGTHYHFILSEEDIE